jgi:NADPH2:quinone reductase
MRYPDGDEVTVTVTAISLNRGETRRAVQQAEPGWRPGWDFVGVIETAAAGPDPARAWSASCHRAPGPNGSIAEHMRSPRCRMQSRIPGRRSLPVAGLAALHALRQGGLLLGRKVLVDGALGGVGHLACQLVAAAGAQV